MIYVMSDLHGCYDKYKQMLEKIKFNSEDILYVLGDIVDRGDNGIKILLDMMKRPNVVPMLGNHEYMAYSVLKKFNVEITAHNYNSHLDSGAIEMYENWMFNGGITTSQAFAKLDKATRDSIMEYLGEFETPLFLCTVDSWILKKIRTSVSMIFTISYGVDVTMQDNIIRTSTL